ncbi:stage V sporulation protein AF [Alteribacillus persepolensis]|uniref:Stage V sporulation protein AF n=1 Tax=Alteribacillus persepolensis TaxID=568899 RepID=A0A1G8AUJ0_9BACI|nr:spore germination protein [Alteribacillus persepolensis]SDH24473.1 stage V sporulation protein AF [Alteribacillus persepolensis]
MSEEKPKQPVFDDFHNNIDYLKQEIGIGESFDTIHLDLHYAGRDMGMFMIDGFANDEALQRIMRFLANLTPEHLEPDPLEQLMKTYLPYIELDKEDDLDKVVFWVLSGATALVVEGINQVIIIDTRTYPVRSPEEPDLERVTRGPRDGFVETIVFNTSLLRRRVRDPSLRMEYMSIGRRSKTDICISYIKDIANPQMIKKIKDSLKDIDAEGFPMGEKTVEEYICGRHWNPYPTVRYTERPDTAAAYLYDGHIMVIVDGSPCVLITPTTFWHHLQHIEEYRQRPVVGTYFRYVRFFSILLAIFLLPLWFLFADNPGLLPDGLDFIGIKEPSAIPLLAQLIMIEIGIDMLRMATIHTPSSMGTALGLVAAIVIGEIAVTVGLLTHEVILYISIVAIGTFATPTYELGLANRLYRLVLLVLTAIFAAPGYIVGCLLWVVFLTRLRSFNIPYLWPFMPFSFPELRDALLRPPVPINKHRPTAVKPQDPDR